MNREVRGTFSFWAELDSIALDDPRVDEVYEIAFTLLEEGPRIEGAMRTWWPWGIGLEHGYYIDLPDGSGFIGYMDLAERIGGPSRIALIHLIWYD
jgi:hypothetical protein